MRFTLPDVPMSRQGAPLLVDIVRVRKNMSHVKSKATLGAQLMAQDAEIERLRNLVAKGLAVVDDFSSNLAQCVLQDYERMNAFCLEARKLANETNPTPVDPGDDPPFDDTVSPEEDSDGYREGDIGY